LLSSTKIDVNYCNQGRTPLYEAIMFGDIESLQTILEFGADPNKVAMEQHPIEILICTSGQILEKLDLLFKYGSDPSRV
jgi:ankyrin repeat protein